ncbi:MAG: maleylacetoacetate isomerase [Pseudomonadota bacterium]|nr:maleylacetoacetate isomerase [Pseudomonadota bacterium]MEE2859700.1 maleylacetoacetate isomerase [Pseudomonadota bacterium]
MTPVLYDFFKSTASWRVRIALNLKGVAYEHHGVWIRGEAHKTPEYRTANPQGLVPALGVGDVVLPQSIAILDWIEATYPEPALLPHDPLARAQVLSAALLIACDIHPLNNRRVLVYLKSELGLDADAVKTWEGTWIDEGFRGLETQCTGTPGPFLFGEEPSLADICLVPQVGNAGRAGIDLADYPVLARAHAAMQALPAVLAAHPDRQPDAVAGGH